MTELKLREQVMLDAGVSSDIMWQGSRITNMLNQAQTWLQLKLIKQGAKNWLKESNALTLANATLLGLNTSSVALPADILYDTPIESAERSTATKPATEVELRNFYMVATNQVLVPVIADSIFIIMDKTIHLFPQDVPNGSTSVKVTHVYRITDLVFDNDSTDSEIPLENQEILIERVVKQIKSIQGNEQVSQAKNAEIDNELAQKYQLDALKEMDSEDRGATK